MGVLEALLFDNLALRALPVDIREGNEIRPVPRACYARVKPTPVDSPRLVAASPSALALLDLDMTEVSLTILAHECSWTAWHSAQQQCVRGLFVVAVGIGLSRAIAHQMN